VRHDLPGAQTGGACHIPALIPHSLVYRSVGAPFPAALRRDVTTKLAVGTKDKVVADMVRYHPSSSTRLHMPYIPDLPRCINISIVTRYLAVASPTRSVDNVFQLRSRFNNVDQPHNVAGDTR
jgi:hypothetical protein